MNEVLYPEYEGYKIVVDDETNKVMYCNIDTGEVVNAVCTWSPSGTYHLTPRAQEKSRAKKEKAEEARLKADERKFWRGKIGGFGKYCFVYSERSIKDVKPETLTRLIYLSTYACYDTGLLMLSERMVMHKSDLPKVLGISDSTVWRFLDDASEYITVNEDNTLSISNWFFRKGLMKRKISIHYQKFYIDTVRRLYKGCRKGDHKRLGYVFQMLPYVNIEYNILCYNPDEKDLSEVKPLSVCEFCRFIGYDYSDFSRLENDYSKITFLVDGHDENFCTFVYDGKDRASARIFVNPRILYSGLNYERVEVLGAFCKK